VTAVGTSAMSVKTWSQHSTCSPVPFVVCSPAIAVLKLRMMDPSAQNALTCEHATAEGTKLMTLPEAAKVFFTCASLVLVGAGLGWLGRACGLY
jgi:hypothetical protein